MVFLRATGGFPVKIYEVAFYSVCGPSQVPQAKIYTLCDDMAKAFIVLIMRDCWNLKLAKSMRHNICRLCWLAMRLFMFLAAGLRPFAILQDYR
jgi:hypothetical protein